MFDRTVIQTGGTTLVPYCKTEIRAPTDDSVKLLKEFEEKALSNLVCKERLVMNGFTCDVYAFRDSSGFSTQIIIRYGLNGRNEEFRCVVEDNDDQLMVSIGMEFAKHLTARALGPKLVELMTSLRRGHIKPTAGGRRVY